MASAPAVPLMAAGVRLSPPATADANPGPPDRLLPMTSAAPPPIPTTGDEEADDELALLRSTTRAIHESLQAVQDLSAERMRLVLSLRDRGVLFRLIADAVPTTENTVYKIHRDARRAKERGEL